MTIVATLHKVKETKGAVRYEEANWRSRSDYLIGTLYLRKAALEAKNLSSFPQMIQVSVEVQ